MAASLMTFTGLPKALWKSKPAHPLPRLCGSTTGRPCRTAPGYPIATASYDQPSARRFTAATARRGVNVGPDATLRGTRDPVARILRCVPPMSTTRTFMVLRSLSGGGFQLGLRRFDDLLHREAEELEELLQRRRRAEVAARDHRT